MHENSNLSLISGTFPEHLFFVLLSRPALLTLVGPFLFPPFCGITSDLPGSTSQTLFASFLSPPESGHRKGLVLAWSPSPSIEPLLVCSVAVSAQ